MKLSKNTILITGGSSGIGLQLAKQLAELDNTIIITGRDQSKLDKVKKELPFIHTYKSDVSDPQEIVSLYLKVTKDFPALNMLINNAGIMKVVNLNHQSSDFEELTNEITTNLKGPIWMTNQFLPHLKKQDSAAIMNVTSVLGLVPLPIAPIYCSTKAALHSYTISLREQLKNTRVKVFDLAPPATHTPLVGAFDKEDAKNIEFMSVEKMVEATIKNLKKDKFDIRPGQSKMIYFLNRLLPRVVSKLMNKSVDRMLLEGK